MKTTIKTLCWIVVLLIGTHASFASAATTKGEVARIWILSSNVVYFRLKGDTCKVKTASANPYWKFSLKTNAGKAWYEMLLASAYAKRPVKISTPVCSPTTTQNIRYVYQDYNAAPAAPAPDPVAPTPTPTPTPTDPVTPIITVPVTPIPSAPVSTPSNSPGPVGPRPGQVFN